MWAKLNPWAAAIARKAEHEIVLQNYRDVIQQKEAEIAKLQSALSVMEKSLTETETVLTKKSNSCTRVLSLLAGYKTQPRILRNNKQLQSDLTEAQRIINEVFAIVNEA